MHRVKDAVPEDPWIVLQVLHDAFPQETQVLLDYLDDLTRELARMTGFLCERHPLRDTDPDWGEAGERIKKACSLLGKRGEKILAIWGPRLKSRD